jgi:DNA-binding transcriptional MerR regulator
VRQKIDKMAIKSPEAFRTISEVSKDLSLPQHVLRFWETKFSQIKPIKRGGGRRYYRPEDVDLLKGIKNLLYNDGYTIRGVQKVIKENGSKNILFSNNNVNLKLKQKTFTDNENNYTSEPNVHSRSGQSLSDNKRKKLMDVMQNLVELQNKISSK